MFMLRTGRGWEKIEVQLDFRSMDVAVAATGPSVTAPPSPVPDREPASVVATAAASTRQEQAASAAAVDRRVDSIPDLPR